jgi:long-chain acyl-CoA synthetase
MGVPDRMMGEKVGAVVVFKPGAKAEPAEICEFLKSRLADFKIPQFMIIRPEALPRNPGGKILKPRLRQEAVWGKALR